MTAPTEAHGILPTMMTPSLQFRMPLNTVCLVSKHTLSNLTIKQHPWKLEDSNSKIHKPIPQTGLRIFQYLLEERLLSYCTSHPLYNSRINSSLERTNANSRSGPGVVSFRYLHCRGVVYSRFFSLPTQSGVVSIRFLRCRGSCTAPWTECIHPGYGRYRSIVSHEV
jgi:hypothetical protein